MAEVIQIYKGWDVCQSQLLARFMKSGNRLIDDFGLFKVIKFSGGKPLSIFHCAKLPND